MVTSQQSTPCQTWRVVLGRWAMAAVAVGLAVYWLIRFVRFRQSQSLPVYTEAAHRMWLGTQVYLRAHDPGATTAPFTYPPFFTLPFVPLSFLPPVVSSVLWFLMTAAALVGVVVLVRKSVAVALPQKTGLRVAAFWSLLTLLVARHVLGVFETHSHDLLVALLLALTGYAACRCRDLGAGFWAGLAAACKATPLLLGPVFLWQRKYRATAVFLLVGVAATLLPDVLLPSRDGTPWCVSWYRNCLAKIQPGGTAYAEDSWSKWCEFNQSLAGTVYRLSVSPLPGQLEVDGRIWSPSENVLRATTMSLQLGVLVLIGLATWPTRRATLLPAEQQGFLQYGQVGAAVCAMLLLSPMSSKAHFAALILPVSFILADLLTRRRDPLVVAMLAVMLVAGSGTAKGFWGQHLGDLFLVCGNVCWTTVACLIATLRTIRQRAADPALLSTVAEVESPRVLPKAA
jgi:hypothetical protein